MRHFLSIIVNAAKVLIFLLPLIAIGTALALHEGVPSDRLGSLVAIPAMAMVLVFKIISTFPNLTGEERVAFETRFSQRTWVFRTVIMLSSLDVIFIVTVAFSSVLFLLCRLPLEAILFFKATVAALALLGAMLLLEMIVELVRRSVVFRDVGMQSLLAVTMTLAVFGPSLLLRGKLPRSNNCATGGGENLIKSA